jgi:hypothetical protein
VAADHERPGHGGDGEQGEQLGDDGQWSAGHGCGAAAAALPNPD